MNPVFQEIQQGIFITTIFGQMKVHVEYKDRFQHLFSSNIWVEIVGNYLIGSKTYWQGISEI